MKQAIEKLLEDKPLPDEIEAIEAANRDIEANGTIPHEAVNWD